MGKKLSPFESELYQRVDEVLHYLWDPIGVAAVPEARDEYYSYLPMVFQMVVNEHNADAIAACLNGILEEGMGLSAQGEQSQRAAAVLLRWAQTLRKQYCV